MSRFTEQMRMGPERLDRRAWLLRAASGGTLLSAITESPSPLAAMQDKQDEKAAADETARELERATAKLRATTKLPIQVVTSSEYQALGDASETFMQTAMNDCELIAADFLTHYQAKGFPLKPPGRRMTIVAFKDDKLFRDFARKFAANLPPRVTGFYSRTENWLVLYDFRQVPELGAALKNVRNLAHEASHQLTYNTGLLNRKGDVPVAIVEGLACYGEARRMHGHTEPGLLNNERLGDLAHVLRRAKWIKVADLFTDDSPAAGRNTDQLQLFYAQSWILIFSLMNSPPRLAQLKTYFKTIFPRVDKKNRLADATKCFVDLDQLDQELRQEAIRLQKELRV